MRTAKIFKSGNSWAVRIPKKYKLKGQVVEIIKHKHEIILREIPQNLSKAFQVLTKFSDDFFSEKRIDQKPQKRRDL